MNELELARDTQFTCFVRRGESVAHALGAASQLTGQQCQVWYQTVAGLYPTQAYLARICAEPSDIYPFCSEERETMGHFTNRCPAFHDASTKAHDEAWHSVVQVVRPLLPPEVVVHFDVLM
eukprot:2278088-Rhodomonas_salina.1